ncbi:MAG TPA: hypothetical protein VMS93_00915 [Candidatus Saccharimonadales bacterium]|nr:hypothetical protein [Candidatus Saccharimonadales bacterium]
MRDTFETIILIGRPAAGKSEVIDYLKKCTDEERRRRFHILPFEELDDFLYVWETFEIDDILSRHGRPRLFTTKDYYFTDPFVWNLYIERLDLEYRKKLARDPAYHDRHTGIIEFSRGGEHAFGEALSHFGDEVLSRAGIVYIKVSYEESCRKNRRRFRPDQADSILYHSLPDEKMEFYYKLNDWDRLAPAPHGFLPIQGHQVPYAVFLNEPEKTDDPAKLGPALEDVFGRLWTQLRQRPGR